MTTIVRNQRRVVLENLVRDYADLSHRSRSGLRVTPGDQRGEHKTTYTVAVVGLIREKRQLVLSAPANEDKSLIAVMKGQTLICEWLNATTAFRFRAMIVRILFDPVPLIYVELPPMAERRTLRGVPRALSNLRALLKTPEDIETVIVDLSVGGARLAVHDDVDLSKGQNVALLARPRMLNRDFQLNLHCTVTGLVPTNDPKHPHVRFYGVTFEQLSDNELLILHSYAQECLSLETDTLSQLLLLNSREVDSAA